MKCFFIPLVLCVCFWIFKYHLFYESFWLTDLPRFTPYFKMLLAPIAGCHSKRIAKEINQKKFQLSSSKTEFFTAVWSFDFFQTLFYFLHAFIRITAHAHTRISRGVEKKLIFSLILMKNPDLKSLWNPLPWIGLTLPNLTLPNLT